MNRKFIPGFILLAIILAGTFSIFLLQGEKKERQGEGTVNIGGDFSLTDQDGAKRSLNDFSGRYMLVYFGYSFCPDICSTALVDISRAIDILGEKGNLVTPVFITIDPERDTVAHLAAYAKNFHPRLVALSGTEEEISQTVKKYRIYRAKAPGTEAEDENYLMDHSSIFYLMGRDGKYVSHFPHGTDSQTMAAGLEKILEPAK